MNFMHHILRAISPGYRDARRVMHQQMNAKLRGVALPEEEIRKRLANVPEKWRDIIDVTHPSYGQQVSA